MKAYFLIIFMATLFSEEKYKTPKFHLIDKVNNIEIRQYDEYIVAKTSVSSNKIKPDNGMFRILASYIFGNNDKQLNMPMTVPVTTYHANNEYNMLFYMHEINDLSALPLPTNPNIKFEKIDLKKCATITFGWYTSKNKIKKYKKNLIKFLEEHNYSTQSSFMLNRYNSPWTLPFLRKNELLIKIK